MTWWSAWKNASRFTICTTFPTTSLSSIIDASRHISASIECGGNRSNCPASESINWDMPHLSPTRYYNMSLTQRAFFHRLSLFQNERDAPRNPGASLFLHGLFTIEAVDIP